MLLTPIKSWEAISAIARQKNLPVVVMVDQDHCPFCRRVEGEFFAAIFASGEFDDRAIFGKISIDDDESIIDAGGKEISTRSFLGSGNSDFTPTILFLDSEKNELAEKMVGLMTPDYYGFYLERSIKRAYKQLNQS